MAAQLPLDGVKVVTVEQAVAAPFASARLADAGAQVFKIERPEGDFARGYDQAAAGQSSYFVWLNRGKTSLTLDLSSDAGKDCLLRHIRTADVLLQNLKPGALARLGVDLVELRRENPRLIVCSISGYGEDGPMASRKAYDLLVQAETGLCSVTGGPESAARVGISIVDIATGATAYSAILEALIRRGITGEGAEISISMFDVMAEWLTVPLLNHENGQSPRRIGMAHPSIAPYGVFHCDDGAPVLISIQSDREWRTFCAEFVGSPKHGTDPRFATNPARVANREDTDQFVADAFRRHGLKTCVERLERCNIAFASVNDMQGLSDHPQLRRILIDTPNGGVSLPAPGPLWAGEERAYGAVPALEHVDIPE